MSAPLDREAVAALWRDSSRRLLGWFERRTASRHDAEDLVGETFLRVQARLGSLRSEERLGAWLAAIAANVLADHGRGRARKGALLEEGEGGPDATEPEAPDGGGAALSAVVAGWVEAFLARLEPEEAALLRAVELEGRPQVEVGRELGLSPSGARSRVQRARARLRRELEACCRFGFDARGNLTEAVRRAGEACGCEDSAEPCG